ncbi:HAMP domain-containing sensor histidine kinase [Luteibacter sp. ME-Dv--P-043b]|uniref:sensor histidine kinase n=1 Tax=Luteibacter sp. ME-Dv--P-043b TaxID=3040291 RepID=UPI00255337EB|nr:HAMP domain-containing sensor histidine kinase [Luteibacter sp. ME-Dv--P-043b]
MPATLSRQLFLVWVLILAGCVGMAGLLFAAWQQSGSMQLAQARQTLDTDCASLVARYNGASADARSESLANGLANVVVQLVLADQDGIEGGVWDNRTGFVAYAYPTYQGSGSKSDVPDAERGNLVTTAAAALSRHETVGYTRSGKRESLLIAACPIDAYRAGWTMTHLAHAPGRSSGLFAAAAGVLLALALASAGALGAIMRRWSRRFAAVEHALAHSDAIPDLPRTGAPELDRLGETVVGYATRLAESHREAATLASHLSRHERLASLGRMTATVAHEIRNPIATLRLAAENALAIAPEALSPTTHASLDLMLAQVGKLDALVETLLRMVQPVRVERTEVDIADWARRVLAELGDGQTAVALRVGDGATTWSLDPAQMERAVDNLLRNALRHRAAGSIVNWSIEAMDGRLVMIVANVGEPMSQEVRDHLFEPFATDRIDGNGLGLALVRDIVEAHNGTVGHAWHDGQTAFRVELPWR